VIVAVSPDFRISSLDVTVEGSRESALAMLDINITGAFRINGQQQQQQQKKQQKNDKNENNNMGTNT
jgi:hypothetical protein